MTAFALAALTIAWVAILTWTVADHVKRRRRHR